jgi:hypothetical protein
MYSGKRLRSRVAKSKRRVVSGAVVVADYPAQYIPPVNRADTAGGALRDRRLLLEALMRARAVVIVDRCCAGYSSYPPKLLIR